MTGLPPPAPSSTPPPRVALPSDEQQVHLPVARPAGEVVDPGVVRRRGYRANLAAGLLPAALLAFLVVAFILIIWTLVASGGAAS